MAKVWRTRYGESDTEVVLEVNPVNPGAVVTDSSLAIWVGNNIATRRVNEMDTRLQACMDAIIELDAPAPAGTPGAEYFVAYQSDIDLSKVRIITTPSDGAIFNDDGIGVLYGPNYPENATGDGRTQLFVSQFDWLKEAFLEWSKVNA